MSGTLVETVAIKGNKAGTVTTLRDSGLVRQILYNVNNRLNTIVNIMKENHIVYYLT